MRKAYISIAALLLCGSMLMAQTPANRTAAVRSYQDRQNPVY